MRKGLLAATTAAALATVGLTGTAVASALPGATTASVSTTTTSSNGRWVVLTERGASVAAVTKALKAAGAKVTSVNKAVGLIAVSSTAKGFAAKARSIDGVKGVAADRSIGTSPKGTKVSPDPIEKEHIFDRSGPKGTMKDIPAPPEGHDPYDGMLWGHEMINAFEAHETTMGDSRVSVGILDTGVQGDHPDIAPNFDSSLSRNFATDIPDIDGPCEVSTCKDDNATDDNGHGTHVAGTIGAALNGLGISGVAPDVKLVNIRGAQDSGYFFLTPTVNALTYAGDIGLDVVNMSFYVDPWLYNCRDGAPEDSPEAAAEQNVIIEGMTRALEYANSKGVTLVGAAGNNHEDLANPRTDHSSPDYDNPIYTWDSAPYARTIDNDDCLDLPAEGVHVLTVSSVGPSGTKSDFSNYTTDLTSGEIEVAAPGGWYRDYFGTKANRTNGNMILSAYPTHVGVAEGMIDAKGRITNDGKAAGILKQCNDAGVCGYYQWIQGTSMAAPHASGVAALAVAAHGSVDSVASRGLTLAPATTKALVMDTATDHACPEGGVQEYLNVGRSAEFTATCVGTPDFNGFYGDGIVNAAGVVD